MPAIQKVREAAARTECANNLRQLGIGVHNFSSSNKQALPDAVFHSSNGGGWTFQCTNPAYRNNTGLAYVQNINVLAQLLPFIDNEPLFKSGTTGVYAGGYGSGSTANYNTQAGTWVGDLSFYDHSATGPGQLGNFIRLVPVKVFRCSADYGTNKAGFSVWQVNGWASSSYAGNWQLFGTPRSGTGTSTMTLVSIKDGTSNTVMFAEKLGACQRMNATSTGGFTRSGNLWTHPGQDWGPFFAGNDLNYLPGTTPTWQTNGPWLQHWYMPPQIQPSINIEPAGSSQEQCDGPARPSTGHNVCLLCMADGSVRDVNSRVSVQTWQAAILPMDGIPPGKDW